MASTSVPIDKPSPKGFVAIDIDGTTLVQKADINTSYAIINRQVSLRNTLVAYIQAAIERRYDIIVLTSRPEIFEPIFAMMMGTHSTLVMLEHLNQHGIDVTSVERARNKGPKMKQLLNSYPKNAKGILFDDQLKQISSVSALAHPQLHAIDINDYDHIIHFSSIIKHELGEYSPKKIVNSILNHPSPFESYKYLQSLSDNIERISRLLNSEELSLLKKIKNDLCLKIYETEIHNYQPDITWVRIVVNVLNDLCLQILTPKKTNGKLIRTACQKIFLKREPSRAKVNSLCDLHLKNFLTLLSTRKQFS